MFRLGVPLVQNGEAVAPVPAPADMAQVHVLGLVVLVVDDDPAVRDGMEHLLRSWGCIAWLAGSLEDAIAHLTAGERPDVIVCDYRLRDGQAGTHVIGALRRKLDTDVPALLITGDTAPERLRAASRSGMPLLHKPVAPDALKWHLGRIYDR